MDKVMKVSEQGLYWVNYGRKSYTITWVSWLVELLLFWLAMKCSSRGRPPMIYQHLFSHCEPTDRNILCCSTPRKLKVLTTREWSSSGLEENVSLLHPRVGSSTLPVLNRHMVSVGATLQWMRHDTIMHFAHEVKSLCLKVPCCQRTCH